MGRSDEARKEDCSMKRRSRSRWMKMKTSRRVRRRNGRDAGKTSTERRRKRMPRIMRQREDVRK